MDKTKDIENKEITEKIYSHPADFLREILSDDTPVKDKPLNKPFKDKYEIMPTSNGKIMRYYLKRPQIDFINEIASKSNKSPSEVLRMIISNYKEIRLLVKKIEC